LEKTDIRWNLEAVNKTLDSALIMSGRKWDTLKLIAVTKLQPPEIILKAISLGIRRFGENYPEETHRKLEKMIDLPQGVEWHMIGHVQSRKIRFLREHFSWIHSVDSVHVAEELSKDYSTNGLTMPILLELNLTGEESKHGFKAWDQCTLEETNREIESIQLLPGIQIQGLMTMPPLSEKAEASRVVYQRLRTIQSDLKRSFPDNAWKELSMGTSFDYPIAVEEGATMVRIGQAIFGPRITG
jgi:PLP dependent protein